jgi:hypothetical protein
LTGSSMLKDTTVLMVGSGPEGPGTVSTVPTLDYASGGTRDLSMNFI